ncbi:hypothetical protein NLI96_g2475 [Meripilus lineatus]|uniref:NAD(P)-binding protein n=1 Tax=Meripilus lineatus TaxID=2056292 RepID=A0AAD5VAN2_9APHY|nr:hypothetical protein NLI96_g2475 [Physisporinus lineatus]
MSSPRVFLITGAASGFGLHLTELILKNGEIAVATDIKLDGLADLQREYATDKLLVRKVDVSQPKEISDAFVAAKDAFGKIDVVYNNAGYGIVSEAEGVPNEDARALFDVVYWGAVSVALEAIKFFREVNGPSVGGRLITTTSMLGIIAMPISAYYTAAKHALEGFLESLSLELNPEWNIKLTIIEPGIFRTGALFSVRKLPIHPAYTKPGSSTLATRGMIDNPDTGADPRKAVKQFYNVSLLSDPPIRLAIGQDAVSLIKQQVAKIVKDVEEYADWSEDLAYD